MKLCRLFLETVLPLVLTLSSAARRESREEEAEADEENVKDEITTLLPFPSNRSAYTGMGKRLYVCYCSTSLLERLYPPPSLNVRSIISSKPGSVSDAIDRSQRFSVVSCGRRRGSVRDFNDESQKETHRFLLLLERRNLLPQFRAGQR